MRESELSSMAVFALAATFLASCSSTGTTAAEAYRGTIRSSCAPTDAPSTELRLEPVDGAGWVWFNLWPAGPFELPIVVRFDEDHLVGQGAYCRGPGDCESAVRGEVELIAGDPEAQMFKGQWTLGMPDGTVHRGVFEAEWLAIQAMCV
jgi:hypothetical protein